LYDADTMDLVATLIETEDGKVKIEMI